MLLSSAQGLWITITDESTKFTTQKRILHKSSTIECKERAKKSKQVAHMILRCCFRFSKHFFTSLTFFFFPPFFFPRLARAVYMKRQCTRKMDETYRGENKNTEALALAFCVWVCEQKQSTAIKTTIKRLNEIQLKIFLGSFFGFLFSP